MKKLVTTAIAALAGAAMFVPLTANAASYNDVHPGDWFYPAVQFVSDNNLMTGYHPWQFGPNDRVTREQAAVILYRNAGSPTSNGDVSEYPDADKIDGWATNAVSWAAKTDTMNGYGPVGSGAAFGPQDSLTREQTAKVIAIAFHKNINAASSAAFNSIRNHERTSGWAYQYMIWATANHVINGWPDARGLDPQGVTSRAQFAQIMTNLLSHKVTFNRGSSVSEQAVRDTVTLPNLPANHQWLGSDGNRYDGNTIIPVNHNVTFTAQHKVANKPVYKTVPIYKTERIGHNEMSLALVDYNNNYHVITYIIGHITYQDWWNLENHSVDTAITYTLNHTNDIKFIKYDHQGPYLSPSDGIYSYKGKGQYMIGEFSAQAAGDPDTFEHVRVGTKRVLDTNKMVTVAPSDPGTWVND